MRRILCYGDSNTFGTNPSGGRWHYNQRWTGILSALLGPDFQIIEEGLGGRTTVFDDPLEPHRSGREFLPVALHSHRPLDLVILSLGTNDCKKFFNADEKIITKALQQLASLIKTHPYGEGYPIPQVLVVSPIHIGDEIERSPFVSFNSNAVITSKQLAPFIQSMAEENEFLYFDASSVAGPSSIDQLHMDRESHQAIGEGLASLILSYFNVQKEESQEKKEERTASRALKFPFFKR
jgi:lysophospholipase L1-like esterase